MKLHFKSAQFQLCAVGFAVAVLAACGSSGTPEDATVPTVPTVAADFSINGVSGTVSGQNVTIDLSASGNCATSVESMVLGIQANGATISPDPTLPRDYSVPVQYTITSPDGKTKVVYTVTVIGAACIAPAPTPTPTPAPTPTPTPTPIACTADPIGTTGYSLVFKGCDVNNVAEYYDKTECVRENATGLIWEGQPAAGTRSSLVFHLRTNYDSLTKLQRYIFSMPPIVFVAPTQAQIDSPNNTIGYQSAVNTSNLCGFSDWRRPSPTELLALVKPGVSPQIDSTWFPNTFNGKYWTGAIVKYVSGNSGAISPTGSGAEVESYAAVINFKTGLLESNPRTIDGIVTSEHAAIRLVR